MPDDGGTYAADRRTFVPCSGRRHGRSDGDMTVDAIHAGPGTGRTTADPGGRAQVIEVRGLTKRYGSTVAVDGIDLTVRGSEIFALLGPNGAGKTTTLEMLEGYRRPDAGTVSVFGEDPARGGTGLAGPDRAGPADLEARPRSSPSRDWSAATPATTRTRATSTRPSSWSASPTSAGPGRAGSPAASNGASTWPSRWSATRTWSSSTSRPPASTRGPASGLVDGGEPPDARQDRAAHHALHGRGRGAGRPRRGDRRGSGRRARDPGDRRRPRHRPGADVLPPAAAGRR